MPTYKPKTSICSSVPNAPCWSFSLTSPVVQAYHWHRAQVQPQYTAPRLDPKSQTQVHKRPWGPKPITVPFSSAPEITQFPTPTSTSLKGASSQKPSLQHFSPPPGGKPPPHPAVGSLPPPPASRGREQREGPSGRPTRTRRVRGAGGRVHRPGAGQWVRPHWRNWCRRRGAAAWGPRPCRRWSKQPGRRRHRRTSPWSSGASPREARGPSRSRSSASAARSASASRPPSSSPLLPPGLLIARGGRGRWRGKRGEAGGVWLFLWMRARGGLGTGRRRSRLPVSHRALGRRARPSGPPFLPQKPSRPRPGHPSPAANLT